MTGPSETLHKDASEYRQDVLLSELGRVSDDIRTHETKSEKILSLGMTVVSFAAVAGISQKVFLVFFLLPLAVAIVGLYTVLTYFYIQSLGGYKRYLEEKINGVLGETLLVWEDLARKQEDSNFTRNLLLCGYVGVAAALMVLSIYEVAEHFGVCFTLPIAALDFFLIPAFFVSSRALLRVHQKIYRDAMSHNGRRYFPVESPAETAADAP